MSFRELFDLTGKHWLVTGAGGGIGRAICRGFCEFGAEGACLDINEEIAGAAAEALLKCGGKALPVVCDVRDPQQIEHAVSYVLEKFGKIDILVNLAGKGILKPVMEFTLEEWEETIQVFLRSTFLFSKAVGKHMVEQGRGSIINISSIASVAALGNGTGPYAAAKAGVNALTREMTVEWARKGVRVNAIAPCQIDTPQLRAILSDPRFGGEKIMNTWLKAIPMGRLGRPEELIGPCIFLASDASSLVTGHTLMVDGGHTIK